MTNRYMTPLKFRDGNGKERRTRVHFELDPIELMDWTLQNPLEANLLMDGLTELDGISEGDPRDLTRDEIRTLLTLIKLLTQLSAGRPTEDGDYFIKDPNWTSSYAYRGFREFLLTNPREVDAFLKALLDNDVMSKFTSTLQEANEKAEMEISSDKQNKRTSDSGEETVEKMREKLRLLEARDNDSN